MKEFTNYARSSSSNLFTELEWVRTWSDFIGQAERYSESLGNLRARNYGSEIFPIAESLRGNPPPGREKGKEVAGTIGARTTGGGGLGTDFDLAGGLQAVGVAVGFQSSQSGMRLVETHATLDANNGSRRHNGVLCMAHGQGGAEITEGYAPTLNCNNEQPIAFPINTHIAMRHEAMGEGTGIGIGVDGAAAYTLQAAHSHAVAYRTNAAGQVMPQEGIAAALNTQTDPCAQILAVAFNACGATLKGGSGARGYPDPSDGNGHNIVSSSMQVRRLTPLCCERLQGFPDNYTNIPGASDSARYKALGNSMACNVMQLIGQRIQMVEGIA